MIVLGFDFGLKRIGVASGNTVLGSATPLEIIATDVSERRFARIGELIASWQPALCVVGLPCHPDGAEHEMTRRCRRFGHQLNGRFGIPVEMVDERYSSVVIPTQGRRDAPVDDQAAAVILQQYFDELEAGTRCSPPVAGASDVAFSRQEPNHD